MRRNNDSNERRPLQCIQDSCLGCGGRNTIKQISLIVSTIIVIAAAFAFVSARSYSRPLRRRQRRRRRGPNGPRQGGLACRGFTFSPSCHRAWDLVSGAPRRAQDAPAPRNLCSHSPRMSRSNRGASAKS